MLLINREFEKCLFLKFENKDWAESKKNPGGNQKIRLTIARSWIGIVKGGFQHKENNGDCTIIRYPRVGVKHT